ncbi:MAG: hypothetical protein QXN93_01915 [Methanomassiliicoccales archaeon]
MFSITCWEGRVDPFPTIYTKSSELAVPDIKRSMTDNKKKTIT